MDVQERSAREARIFELRAKRTPWREIGKELGISHVRAIQIFEAARDRLPAARLADLREEEGELLDRGIANLLTIAENDRVNPRTGNPEVSYRTRVEAWNAIRAKSESRRKLFGVDAPQRKEVTVLTEDVVDAALRKAAEEHAAKVAELEALENTAILEAERLTGLMD